LVEELLRLIADYLGKSPDESFAQIKEYVIHTRFAHQIDRQICQSVVAHLKYQLTAIELSKKNDDEAADIPGIDDGEIFIDEDGVIIE